MVGVAVGWLGGLHWRVGDASSRGSHMCGSWYFPMFLLRGGSWTRINMDSLMVLEWLVVSLCRILKPSASIGWPVVVLCWCMGEGALKCSLILSPSALPDSPIYVLSQFMWGHL